MKPDVGCDRVRVELSARMDGEVDAATTRAINDHLSWCDDCKAHNDALRRVRSTLRAQPAEDVPDLSGAILERVAHEGPRGRRRDLWTFRARVAVVAAAASALLLVGASLPWTDRRPDRAAASEIVRSVRAAARSLATYEAAFDVVERGWHPQVPVRRFRARVWFDAPERFRLQLRDRTDYPDGGRWPRNDVDVIGNAKRSWIREPSSCPTPALPGCAIAPATEERSIVRREPFDGTSSLPTDIIVPLETLADSRTFEVRGETRLLGRDAYRIELSYGQAVPLFGGLQQGGVWRTLRPTDRVELWLDEQTWFPLRFAVFRGDRRSPPLLSVSAASFSQPDRLDRRIFAAPARGIRMDGGFFERDFDDVARAIAPAYVAGLDPYRAGVTRDGRHVLAFSDGTTWLKVATEGARRAGATYRSTAEQVRLSDDSFGYYEPAAQFSGRRMLRRRVDVYGTTMHVHLESNLPRAEVLRVAGSVAVQGKRIPSEIHRRGITIKRVAPERVASMGFAEEALYLPSGYRARVALIVRTRSGTETLKVYYRRAQAEYDGVGIRITQSPSVDFLPPPSSEGVTHVPVGRALGRWSEERGELEWIDDGVYRAIAVPSFDLSTALRIAESLR